MKKYLIVFVLLFTSLMVFSGCAAQQATTEIPSIDVVGTGKITTEPDTVEIRISVVTESKNKNVQEINAEKTQKVIDALTNLGLEKEEMETQNVNFYPLRHWTEKGGEQITGYRAENTLVIKTQKIEKAGQIADTAVEKGAQRIGNLSFSLSDEGKEKLLDKAIEEAVSDAKKQAEAVAKAADVEIVGIENISVLKSLSSRPIYYEAKMRAENEVETPVIPKDTEYTVTVNVEFKIK